MFLFFFGIVANTAVSTKRDALRFPVMNQSVSSPTQDSLELLEAPLSEWTGTREKWSRDVIAKVTCHTAGGMGL